MTELTDFLQGEEVRAYATGIDLNRPLRLLADYTRREFSGFTASYVPGSFDSVEELRFENRGLTELTIVNGGVESSAGFILVGQ